MIRLGVEDGMWGTRMADFEQPWWYELQKTQFPPLPWTDPPLLFACQDMLDSLETYSAKKARESGLRFWILRDGKWQRWKFRR
jgi:hypothetical protein